GPFDQDRRSDTAPAGHRRGRRDDRHSVPDALSHARALQLLRPSRTGRRGRTHGALIGPFHKFAWGLPVPGGNCRTALAFRLELLTARKGRPTVSKRKIRMTHQRELRKDNMDGPGVATAICQVNLVNQEYHVAVHGWPKELL